MSTYSPVQIINLIRQQRGGLGDGQIVYATSIALAESGGNLDAISPSGDYGLWQINRRWHFGDGIISDNNWTDPVTQFWEMWKLSSGMQNWGAWCTAYSSADVARCGQLDIPAPQSGSPAADQENVAGVWLARIRGTPPPGGAPNAVPPNEQLSPAALSDYEYVRDYLRSGYATQLLTINGIRNALDGIYT